MSIKLEPPASIKTEPEEEPCVLDLFPDNAERIKPELVLYADHDIKGEMVIGPTEVQHLLTGLDYKYWNVCERVLKNEVLGSEYERLRMFSCRVELVDAADELLCARCGQWSLTRPALHQHQRTQCTNGRGDQKPLAIETIDNEQQATDKTNSYAHALKNKTVQCQHCNKSFTKLSSLRRHILRHRHEKTNSNIQHVCDQCGKHYSNASALSRHTLTHTNTVFYKCEHCDKKLQTFGNLTKHMVVHTKHKKYKCDECDKRFYRKYDVTRHKVSHSSESDRKPNVCELCHKNFSSKSNLTQHTFAIHRKAKPFVCDDCGKSFTSKHNLSQHVLLHSNTRPFWCDQCDMRFTVKSCFTKHLLTHGRPKRFSCEQCGKRFVHITSLLAHMRTRALCGVDVTKQN